MSDRLNAALASTYRIERELGAGGMATVYLAEDLRHRRKVAIKVLHPELSAVIGSERFLKEIELTANLQQPHILPLFDSGDVSGQLYYVMPFVEGETLRSGRFAGPVWSPDGREIIAFDYETHTFNTIAVRAGAPPEFGQPVRLFSPTGGLDIAGMDFHVLRDGRIVFLAGPERTPTRALTLLTDWRVAYARLAAQATRP